MEQQKGADREYGSPEAIDQAYIRTKLHRRSSANTNGLEDL